MRVLTVVGARPQFIKAAAVSRQIRKASGVQEILVHTGQHYDANMSDVFFKELDIPEPNFNLGIGSMGHGAQTGKMLEGLELLIQQNQPDWMLVYGDTNSTLAGALAAAKLHLPVAHVEAGLRSFNRAMPEEINRVVTDHLSTLLFAPTDLAKKNLATEGISGANVLLSGDVMYDVAKFYAAKSDASSTILAKHSLKPREFVLATLHRAENTDHAGNLGNILRALQQVSRKVKVVLPLHPRTRKLIETHDLEAATQGIELTEPASYLDMIALEKNAAVIATDSGGVQKEAYFFGVPCVTFREQTEWVELVETGWNRLVPPKDTAVLANAILESVGRTGKDVALYGQGNAAENIVEDLVRFHRERKPVSG